MVRACLLFFRYIFCALYCKCGDIKVYGRYWKVFIFSSVHVEYVFRQKGMFWRIGTNSGIVSSGLSPLPALTWTFITLYLFLTKWFYLFWDPPMRHMWTAHVDIFYCYVFCQTAENKIIHTGITELSKRYRRTKYISYDPHT